MSNLSLHLHGLLLLVNEVGVDDIDILRDDILESLDLLLILSIIDLRNLLGFFILLLEFLSQFLLGLLDLRFEFSFKIGDFVNELSL